MDVFAVKPGKAWSTLDSSSHCDSKLHMFNELVKIELDTMMPLKTYKLHHNNAPWVTDEFKTLIASRQHAFVKGNLLCSHCFLNQVNRERKLCRNRYYASKVANFKNTKPRQWWSDVKKIAGMTPAAGSEDVRSCLHIDGIEGESGEDIANFINAALLHLMQDYMHRWTVFHGLPAIDSEIVQPSVSEVCSVLLAPNSRKAPGPDGLPSWLLKEYADFLAGPICDLLCCSFDEHRLPSSWKYADATPLPKEKPVIIIIKHIRPICLTPVISKVAEKFTVRNHVGPAVLGIIDPSQFGAIPKSSTTQGRKPQTETVLQ